jgi:hypothetical protein
MRHWTGSTNKDSDRTLRMSYVEIADWINSEINIYTTIVYLLCMREQILKLPPEIQTFWVFLQREHLTTIYKWTFIFFSSARNLVDSYRGGGGDTYARLVLYGHIGHAPFCIAMLAMPNDMECLCLRRKQCNRTEYNAAGSADECSCLCMYKVLLHCLCALRVKINVTPWSDIHLQCYVEFYVTFNSILLIYMRISF